MEIRRGTLKTSQLFCGCCQAEITHKKSTLGRHVKSKTHVSLKQKMAKSASDKAVIDQFVNGPLSEVAEPRLGGSGKRVFQLRVVKAFLQAGISLNKLDSVADLRAIIEEGAYPLGHRTTLDPFVDTVLEMERELVATELGKERNYSVIFDGVTKVAETYCIIFRFVNANDWKICQRLVDFRMVDCSMKQENLAGMLIECIMRIARAPTENLSAAIADGVAVNLAAIRRLQLVGIDCNPLVCHSHGEALVGGRINRSLDNYKKFQKSWNTMIVKSTTARDKWSDVIEKAPVRCGGTRWWEELEQAVELLAHYRDLLPFLRSPDLNGICTGSTASMQRVIDDNQAELDVELAALVEYGTPFAATTYQLEGDKFLMPFVAEKMRKLVAHTNKILIEEDHPGITAAAMRYATDATTGVVNGHLRRQLEQHARDCLADAHQFFLDVLVTAPEEGGGRHGRFRYGPQLVMYDAAELVRPDFVVGAGIDINTVDLLRKFNKLTDDAVIALLKTEFPAYVVLAATVDAADVNDPDKLWAFWKKQTHLPAWRSAVKEIALYSPSSAGAERVFSMYKAMFDDSQALAGENKRCASITIRYNQVQREKERG